MIKEYKVSAKAQAESRKYGISDATFYKRKACFDGLNVSDATTLGALENENSRLKWMFADGMLDTATVKDFAKKNFTA